MGQFESFVFVLCCHTLFVSLISIYVRKVLNRNSRVVIEEEKNTQLGEFKLD